MFDIFQTTFAISRTQFCFKQEYEVSEKQIFYQINLIWLWSSSRFCLPAQFLPLPILCSKWPRTEVTLIMTACFLRLSTSIPSKCTLFITVCFLSSWKCFSMQGWNKGQQMLWPHFTVWFITLSALCLLGKQNHVSVWVSSNMKAHLNC